MKRLILVAALAMAAAPLAAADLFYLDLMRDGTHAYDRGDFPLATRHFRLACFGMLDEPKLLGECLARLALAQDKGKDVAGFRETFGRLVEIEERFQGYSQSNLPPEARTLLEQRMTALIPAPTLAASPQALRGTVRKPEGPATQTTTQKTPQTTARPPAAKPQSDQPQPIERSVAPSTQLQAPPPAAPTVAPQKDGALVAAPPAASPAPRETARRETTEAERKQLEKARKLLAETGNVRQLREAFQLAREVADAHPEARETQQLAGEAAYRISRWSEAADYLGRAGGPGEDQPELLFYLAVALYESGNSQAAAAPLRRALPNLQRTPYVDGYAKKILGQ